MRKHIKIQSDMDVVVRVKNSDKTYRTLARLLGGVNMVMEADTNLLRFNCEVCDVRGIWDVENDCFLPNEFTEQDIKDGVYFDYDIPIEDIVSVELTEFAGLGAEPIELKEDYGEKVVENLERFNLKSTGDALAALFEKSELGEFRDDCDRLFDAIYDFEQKYAKVMNIGAIFNNDNIGKLFDELKEKMRELSSEVEDFHRIANMMQPKYGK